MKTEDPRYMGNVARPRQKRSEKVSSASLPDDGEGSSTEEEPNRDDLAEEVTREMEEHASKQKRATHFH